MSCYRGVVADPAPQRVSGQEEGNRRSLCHQGPKEERDGVEECAARALSSSGTEFSPP
jgi:hypothetical protein